MNPLPLFGHGQPDRSRGKDERSHHGSHKRDDDPCERRLKKHHHKKHHHKKHHHCH